MVPHAETSDPTRLLYTVEVGGQEIGCGRRLAGEKLSDDLLLVICVPGREGRVVRANLVPPTWKAAWSWSRCGCTPGPSRRRAARHAPGRPGRRARRAAGALGG
ncbi:hypothetical protein [Caulobacter hibisci]|uniref:Uncharacterized protein n=1 Tax=Caulobacter hibisci TaxID=2035993 RepID=A0ABS0T273_9CAUL|nr:hypothetical protein [Caulobacter hibisci]MBI1685200.1 hypothetical protein [Caulobacter hibisci]